MIKSSDLHVVLAQIPRTTQHIGYSPTIVANIIMSAFYNLTRPVCLP